MSSIREKQISQLKGTIFVPLISLLVAWAVFFVIISFNATKAGMSIPDALTMELAIFTVICAAILCFYIPLLKIYYALKSIPKDTPHREKSIRCVKVKFIHTGAHKLNYRRFCGVVLMDENGIKYTYALEEVQFSDREKRAPYQAYEGTTVSLIYYGDTTYVEQIRC